MIPSPAEPYAQTSISRLVTLTGLTPRSVFSALKTLEAEGRIARSRESLIVSNTYEILGWQPTSSPEQQETAELANSCLPEQVQPATPPETEMELLLQLVADTYRPMDDISDLIAFVAGDLTLLRVCLTEIRDQGRVAPDSPAGLLCSKVRHEVHKRSEQ